MDDVYSELFVFLLYSDGTLAWVSANTATYGQSPAEILGETAWNRCGPEDKDRIRDILAKLMLDHHSEPVPTVIRNVDGERLMVSMERLPIDQPSEHAVVGWCRRLSNDVLKLTDREREVLELVCDELTSEQIAKQLHITNSTVETHRQNIAKKLGTNSVVGQVRAAIRGGLVKA